MSWSIKQAHAAAALAILSAGAALSPAARAALPLVVVLKPGESAEQSVRDALRDAQFARLPAAEAAVLLRPTNVVKPSAAGAPRITSGKVVSSTLNPAVAPGIFPVMTVNFQAAKIVMAVVLTFTSPHGQQLISTYEPPAPKLTQGSWTFQSENSPPAGLYAEPGAWTLSDVYITDSAGQKTDYNAAQAAQLFKPASFTVVNNGTPDFTPPTVSAGTILTHVLNLAEPGAGFRASMTVADDVSGVGASIIVVQSTAASARYPVTQAQTLPLPVLNGTIDTYIQSTDFKTQPGTWSIVGYGAVDLAANIFMDTKPADIKAVFGRTSFLVVTE
jgi:hypothetical protein